jgi:hypothetical protein
MVSDLGLITRYSDHRGLHLALQEHGHLLHSEMGWGGGDVGDFVLFVPRLGFAPCLGSALLFWPSWTTVSKACGRIIRFCLALMLLL